MKSGAGPSRTLTATTLTAATIVAILGTRHGLVITALTPAALTAASLTATALFADTNCGAACCGSSLPPRAAVCGWPPQRSSS